MSSAPILGAERTEPSLESIFRAELPYVWNALRRLGIPERDRTDVAHDVFVAVHRQLETYDASRPVRPWLFGFAFRCASDYRRKAHRVHEVLAHEGDTPANEMPSTRPPADDVLGTNDLLSKALDALDVEKRALIILHELEERPVPEISRALGIPLQTVYSRLNSAREELASAVRRLSRPGEKGSAK
jgi:RNA polymerase sigma-70 factor (ECF subfamily)